MQPSLFRKAEGDEKRPLLVGLHTWSHNRFNQVENLLPLAEKHNFNLLLPEFRGANLIENPIRELACGSKAAREDIYDAICYIKENFEIDSEKILLIGFSGGGHMGLLMAGCYPELFRAVSVFVPVTDLKKWHSQNENYAPHIKACCKTKAEMTRRSPVSFIDGIAKANVKIFAGKYDKTIPVAHSEDLYRTIRTKYPDAKIYLDTFDGGHEMDLELAMHFFSSQIKEKQTVQVTG